MSEAEHQSIVNSIVAIAASAGGLEATSLLAQNLPVDEDCCYVIAQHMSPSHKSMLVQLLSRETKLVVEELEHQTLPKPNVIYVPPPGYDVVYREASFQLREPSGHPASPKPSADRLFTSLAETLRGRAIGVVLSGTGSDGSYGVQAVREHGGITIAQEPSTCKYDSMPISAIWTGCVDLTLTPQQMGEHLSAILKQPRDLAALKELNERSHRTRDLFDILLSHTLVDFRQYKETTINRRIQRRMIAKNIGDFDEYVDLCRRSIEEVKALYRDLLISVTRFFRDPEQFKALRNTIKAEFENIDSDRRLRVWIPGCATGEEAYSIAILIIETLGGIDSLENERLQIFATDIDENALQIGRKGVYPQSAITDIPPEYVEKYFDLKDDTLCVKPKLRNYVLFSRHNVFQDAPFTNIDLVSIRNVLIYFNTKLQERVLTRIVYALRPKGLLFLGTSETLGAIGAHFSTASNAARIFSVRDRKRSVNATDAAFRGLHSLPAEDGRYVSPPTARFNSDEWGNFDRLAKAVIKNGVVTNREQNILRVYGDIAPYSQLTSKSFGQANLSLLRKPLASDAASLVLVALKQKTKRTGQWHEVPELGGGIVQLTAYPMAAEMAEPNVSEDLVLIGIETMDRPDPKPSDTQKTEYVAYIEDELSRTRDALQVTVEQLQTSNEELQSLNEELQSSNEELQATNEELETSNEELQSTNEELITVNEELLVNSSQLERTTAELIGLVTKNLSPVLMVDQGLIVRHASAQAQDIFELSERGDGFGHLSQLKQPAGFPPLVDLCSQALLSRKDMEAAVDQDGAATTLKVSPLVAPEGQLIGLVLQVLQFPEA